MKKLTVYSQPSLSKAIGQLRKLFEETKYFTITIKTGKKRSINQNFVMHGWFSQVSDELQEYTAGEIKCQCKYYIGLPILRGADEEFNRKCQLIIDPLPLEVRIEAMELIPVTSIMSTGQLQKLMEAMQRNYAGRVDLKFDKED